MFHADVTLCGWLGVEHPVSLSAAVISYNQGVGVMCVHACIRVCCTDMTSTVDWTLKANDVYIYLAYMCVCGFVV